MLRRSARLGLTKHQSILVGSNNATGGSPNLMTTMSQGSRTKSRSINKKLTWSGAINCAKLKTSAESILLATKNVRIFVTLVSFATTGAAEKRAV